MADAFNEVPEAVANPSHDVDVPFVNERLESEPLVAENVVALKFEANAFVEVVFVPVAFVQMILLKFEGDVPVSVRLAIVAFVANRFVVVALVVVAFVNTPVDGIVAPTGVPLIAPPLIVAFEEMSVGAVSDAIDPDKAFTAVPLAVAKPNQDVDVPFANDKFVTVPFVVAKFVAWPLVTNKFVEVVFVPVAFVQMRFGKLELCEPVIERFVTDKLVSVAFVASKFVIVPFVATTAVAVTEAKLPFHRNAAEPSESVASTDGKKSPVEVPPANWSARVVVFPAFVTV